MTKEHALDIQLGFLVSLVWWIVAAGIVYAIIELSGCAAPSQAWYQNQALQASIDNASTQAALNSTIESIGQRR